MEAWQVEGGGGDDGAHYDHLIDGDDDDDGDSGAERVHLHLERSHPVAPASGQLLIAGTRPTGPHFHFQNVVCQASLSHQLVAPAHQHLHPPLRLRRQPRGPTAWSSAPHTATGPARAPLMTLKKRRRTGTADRWQVRTVGTSPVTVLAGGCTEVGPCRGLPESRM